MKVPVFVSTALIEKDFKFLKGIIFIIYLF